ncbi:MAG: LemA family protein [Lentisphaeria bacterium]|nr:LemA family protein [Lentisphaeria bacterium]
MPWGLIITIAVVAIVVFWWIGQFNLLHRLKIAIAEAWSGIDVQLKRKANIIPNLVDTLKMQMNFESTLLTELTAARSGLVGSDRAEAMAASDKITAMLPQIRATAENYPALGTNQSFLKLMEDIRDCEDKIAYARNRYNMTTARFNMEIVQFPGSVVASVHKFAPEPLFEIGETARRDADDMRISKL